MMFGYGGGWSAWELALMWVGMIAFVGPLVWAVCALAVNATRKPGRPGYSARQRARDPR